MSKVKKEKEDIEVNISSHPVGESKPLELSEGTKVEEKIIVDNIITIKVVETEKGKPRCLPGARVTLAPYFSSVGTIITGLSREDTKRFEDLLNIKLDKEFWSTFSITLSHRPTYLDISDPWNELRYKFLRSHYEVANSVNEITSKTNFVIYDEAEEAKKENKIFKKILEAYSAIHDMSMVERAEFINLFGIKASNISDEVILTKLKQKADEDPNLFISLYTDPNKQYKVLLKKLVQYEVIRKSGQAFFYGEDILGGNEELSIAYLKDPKNQELLRSLKQILQIKERK